MSWRVEYYEQSNGRKPVFEFIEGLPTKDKAKVLKELELLEDYGIVMGPPRATKITGEKYKKLWELRIKYNRNCYRIFYFLYIGRLFILLHAVIKKKNKTNENDLEISKKRMLNYISKG